MAGRGDDHRLGDIRQRADCDAGQQAAQGVPIEVPVPRVPPLAVGDDLACGVSRYVISNRLWSLNFVLSFSTDAVARTFACGPYLF